MSDLDDAGCDVCISDSGDGDLPAFSSTTEVKARKVHRCGECGDGIPVGTVYERTVGKWDGKVLTIKTCLACAEIRNTLCCDGWTYGLLWENARETAFETLTTGCLAQLTTAAAKTKLLAVWRDWKGLDDE